jgi:hypothetical protein
MDGAIDASDLVESDDEPRYSLPETWPYGAKPGRSTARLFSRDGNTLWEVREAGEEIPE